MKLLPPEPEVILYDTEFGSEDYFNRKEFGMQISALINRVDDPFVLAIDGSWGSGKSFFLKRWVAAHSTATEGKHNTVYFDAFEHDFLEEPLVSLSKTVLNRFSADKKHEGLVQLARTSLAKFAAPATRIGLAVLTAGATEITGAVVDAGLDAGSAELKAQVDKFWAAEDGKSAAMHEFRTILTKLTSKDEKLVVVVDELDRCRPDYALSVLEIIKHFFTVENVVFVLGVNTAELENIVRKRYGEGVNAPDYLRKFITLTAKLPDRLKDSGRDQEICIKYLFRAASEMGLESEFANVMARYVRRALLTQSVSVRSVQRILSEMVLVPVKQGNSFANYYVGYQEVICALIVMKVLNRDIYEAALNRKLTMQQVSEWLSLTEIRRDRDRDAYLAHLIFSSCLAPEDVKENEAIRNFWGVFGLDEPEAKVSQIAHSHVEALDFLNSA